MAIDKGGLTKREDVHTQARAVSKPATGWAWGTLQRAFGSAGPVEGMREGDHGGSWRTSFCPIDRRTELSLWDYEFSS